MSNRVVILGSTGSIGQQTLDVMAQHPEVFSPYALVANRSADRLYQQCLQYRPTYAVMADKQAALTLTHKLQAQRSQTQVLLADEALETLMRDPNVDTVVAAIVGAAGLLPTFVAAQAGKRILLANKEALVMAGELFMSVVKASGAVLLPVDSEHNAIFQSMPGGFLPGQSCPKGVQSIVLTASGGPFLSTPLPRFSAITPEQAVAHPNWDMGAKISVDSATMMNKVLEVIEAHFLFALPADRIEVLIHPQSIVHSMVRYQDGSTLAQMGLPDMRTPIAHCLAWPERLSSAVAVFDLAAVGNLTFMPVDSERFSCFAFAKQVLSSGQAAITALNAANEEAVAAFLQQKIGFLAMKAVIEQVLFQHDSASLDSIDGVLAADQAAREVAKQVINRLK